MAVEDLVEGDTALSRSNLKDIAERLTKEHSINPPDNKLAKNTLGFVDTNQLSAKAKAKGNSVTPYSLEEDLMGDQNDHDEDVLN